MDSDEDDTDGEEEIPEADLFRQVHEADPDIDVPLEDNQQNRALYGFVSNKWLDLENTYIPLEMSKCVFINSGHRPVSQANLTALEETLRTSGCIAQGDYDQGPSRTAWRAAQVQGSTSQEAPQVHSSVHCV